MKKPDKNSPIRETDDEARALARRLIRQARFAAIATIDQATGFPAVSRIAVHVDDNNMPFFLASDLSGHSKAISTDPRISILCGEPPAKGDPLAFPRVTVFGVATKVDKKDGSHMRLRSRWLDKHPKAELYIDFGDFNFYRIDVKAVSLNGGFGKAYEMTAGDLIESV